MCLFCYWFCVSLENFALKWRRYHNRWRAANDYLYLALMTGLLIVPHLLWVLLNFLPISKNKWGKRVSLSEPIKMLYLTWTIEDQWVSRVSSNVCNIIFGADEDELESVNFISSTQSGLNFVKTVNLLLIIGTNYRHIGHKIIMITTEANKIYNRPHGKGLCLNRMIIY